MLTYVQNTISLSTLQYLNLVIVLRNYSHRNLLKVTSFSIFTKFCIRSNFCTFFFLQFLSREIG